MVARGQTERDVFSTVLQQSSHITIDVPGVPNDKVDIPQKLVKFEKRTVVQNVRDYTPNVIEPSFGIGRILYSLLEHVYWHRPGDAARAVCSSIFSMFNTYANLRLRFCPCL